MWQNVTSYFKFQKQVLLQKLYNLIKFLSGSGNHDCGLQQLVDNDGAISNKVEIAETLNSFFLNQKNHLNPHDLHCQPKQAPPPTPYQVSGTLNLPHLSKERVIDLLLSVPLHKATSDNGVTVKLLRIAAPAITDSLCKLINYCINTQTFPIKWKDSKVTPIYKGQGSQDDLRSIFVTTCMTSLRKMRYSITFSPDSTNFTPPRPPSFD